MAKTKEIQYPSKEWIDKWVDTYLDKHPTEKVSDFTALEQRATDAWWDNEIDHNRPTPFDFTEEEEKNSKEARKMGTRKAPTVYKFDTKKKPKDAEKVDLLQKIFGFVATITENCSIANEGKEITFLVGDNEYSLTLTKHRPPKAK